MLLRLAKGYWCFCGPDKGDSTGSEWCKGCSYLAIVVNEPIVETKEAKDVLQQLSTRLGVGHWVITRTFTGSVFTCRLCQSEKVTEEECNSHFSAFKPNLFSRSYCRILQTWMTCYSGNLKKICHAGKQNIDKKNINF